MKDIVLDPGKKYYRTIVNEGNFIGMVKLMADENKILADHIEQCQQVSKDGRRNEFTFVSASFIKSAFSAIKKHIVEKIVNEIKRNGGQFGLLVDRCRDIM